MAHEQQSHSPISHAMDGTSLDFPFFEVPLPFGLTRFMVMEVIVAVLIIAIAIPLARHVAKNPVTRGRWFNLWEMMVEFVRDSIVKQGIPEHDVPKFLPFFLTLFLFILFNNLIGQIPLGGATATANINVTGALAVIIFGIVFFGGISANGVIGFFQSLVPPLDLPWIIKPFFWLLVFTVELMSLFIKHVVLAIRLFANMFAGHTVQAVILGFILSVTGSLFWLVLPASLVGGFAILGLELLVAGVQAFLFCLLSSIFIGTALHPHH